MADKEYIPGGKADGMEAKSLADKHGISVEYIEKQLKMGTDVEYEHSPDKNIAREIAKDHIFESPMYYDYLHEMEEKMESNLKSDIEKIKSKNNKKKVKKDSVDSEDIKKETIKRLFG